MRCSVAREANRSRAARVAAPAAARGGGSDDSAAGVCRGGGAARWQRCAPLCRRRVRRGKGRRRAALRRRQSAASALAPAMQRRLPGFLAASQPGAEEQRREESRQHAYCLAVITATSRCAAHTRCAKRRHIWRAEGRIRCRFFPKREGNVGEQQARRGTRRMLPEANARVRWCREEAAGQKTRQSASRAHRRE